MEEKVRMSFDEITSVDSIEALIDLYAMKGHFFPSERGFLDVVSRDWQAESERIWDEALSKSVPTKLPSLDVVVDGATYKIYGIISIS